MTYSFFSSPSVIAFSTERNCTYPENPYDGFNITPYTGDNPLHVQRCRKQLCEKLSIPDTNLLLPKQVHGTRIVEITASAIESYASKTEGVDALITNLPNVCIGVSTADCFPILIYDKRTGAIAAIHAGWRGTVARIVNKTVNALSEAYGTTADNLECIIGPGIGPEAFEVGDEVYRTFADACFPMDQIAFHKNGKWHIDLCGANIWLLNLLGVPANAIQADTLCTHTHYDRFFSARRLGINSGRIFTGIMKRHL